MIPFEKMNGLGNEIIVADMRETKTDITPKAAIALSKKRDTAFDQIMAVHKPIKSGSDYHIVIWNSDGSKAQACGNGTRCVVEWLYKQNLGDNFKLDTVAGIVRAKRRENGLVSVDMGIPHLEWQEIPVSHPIADTNHADIDIGRGLLHDASLVSMGNPHAIFFVGDDIEKIALDKYGPELEHDPFFPERCNISIAHVTSPTSLTLRTWERGAGLTRACGTASCAATVAASRRGLTKRHVTVTLPGGKLDILWDKDNHIIMTGPTEFEFSGKFDPVSGEYQRIS
ncbi:MULTISPECIES: diaminopimelate epimerase [Bartonella]|uniref:diaminopimelate epimerase n=1 Tax=Bartonella TaxID=773 RepID=UPI0018DC348E|nr:MULTISPECIES: diaminopimelate epimerase [Bartonella]MBI0170249.1 diaminopimelate epimerase [Bartonella sp. W8167]MBI0175773.1 diaminopimelate epimerase [Bartonella apis]